VGASEHIHAVDLVERKAVDRPEEMPSIDGRWTRLAEPLSGKSDPSR